MRSHRTDHDLLVTTLEKALSRYGVASRQYVTASLNFGGANAEPDLIFTPAKGPNAGKLVILEIKTPSFSVVPDLVLVEALRHARILERLPGEKPDFVLVVGADLTERQEKIVGTQLRVYRLSGGSPDETDAVARQIAGHDQAASTT